MRIAPCSLALLMISAGSVQTALAQTKIGNSIGLIVLRDNLKEKDTVTIFNADGSVWYKFSFYYDDREGQFDYPNENFMPYAFKPDYFLFVLEVVKADKTDLKLS